MSKEVICPDGFVCPKPSDFTILVDGNSPNPSTFAGSAAGTVVSLIPGPYSVTEQPRFVSTPGLIAKDPVFSQGCSGNIPAGVQLSCNITNEFIVQPPPVVTSVTVSKEVICPDGFVCPKPSDFTILVDGNSPNPSTFAGSAAGTVVSLIPGPYSVTEQPRFVSTPGLIAERSSILPRLQWKYTSWSELSCNITNEFTSDTLNVGSAP